MRPFLILLCLTACAEIPEVDAAMNGRANAPPPSLLPVDVLQAQAGIVIGAEAGQASLQARVAALRARAAQIRAMPVT
jgi:hypothetical protein